MGLQCLQIFILFLFKFDQGQTIIVEINFYIINNIGLYRYYNKILNMQYFEFLKNDLTVVASVIQREPIKCLSRNTTRCISRKPELENN